MPVWEIAQWMSVRFRVPKTARPFDFAQRRFWAPGFGIYLETHLLGLSHSTAAVLGSKDGRTIPLFIR